VIAKSRLINRSSPTPVRADTMVVRLDAGADPPRCLTILEAAVQTCMRLLPQPAPRVSYAGLSGDGGTYEIEYSVASSDDLAAARTELLSHVHRHLFHAGIALAVAGTPHPPTILPATVSTMIDRSDLFGTLPDAEREQFAKRFVAVSFDKGETLILEGSGPTSVFLIASGAVEVTAEARAAKAILARLGPGEVIGLVGLLMDRPHPATGACGGAHVVPEHGTRVEGDGAASGENVAQRHFPSSEHANRTCRDVSMADPRGFASARRINAGQQDRDRQSRRRLTANSRHRSSDQENARCLKPPKPCDSHPPCQTPAPLNRTRVRRREEPAAGSSRACASWW
jgi:hypothetical protein